MRTGNQKIALTVKHFRALSGITQKQLAQASGTSKAYISQIECGRKSWVSFSLICRICEGLNITPNDFYYVYLKS